MRKSFYNVRMRRSRANTRFHGIYGRFQDFTKFRKISGFHVRFQDFTKDFKISRKISLEVYEIPASGEPLVRSSIAMVKGSCTLEFWMDLC